MADNFTKAQDFVEKGEKKLKSFGFFAGSTKYEDAGEFFQKAANLFKIAKRWQEAGDAFMKCAECHIKLDSKHEAATDYMSAATCFKKSSTQDAINVLQLAIEIYTDTGRFSSAGRCQKDIAEIYESENDLDHAIEAYQAAADYFIGEDSTSAANQLLLKVALFSAQQEDYNRAIEIYESIASDSLDSNLLKWSVKDYYLRAGLCHLCNGDVVTASNALKRYSDTDVTFQSTREYKFLEDIIQTFENMSVDDFTNVVFEYDSISPLDAWKTTILLRVKKQIKGDIT